MQIMTGCTHQFADDKKKKNECFLNEKAKMKFC